MVELAADEERYEILETGARSARESGRRSEFR